jgi:uncharacterized protein (DUF427 family)
MPVGMRRGLVTGWLRRLLPGLRPRVQRVDEPVEVTCGAAVVARAEGGLRVLQRGHRPAYYLPAAAFDEGSLRPTGGRSWCPWKGVAAQLDVVNSTAVASGAAWTYPSPRRGFTVLQGQVGVDDRLVDRLTVGGLPVEADRS